MQVGCLECVAATWVRDAAGGPTLADDISEMIGRQIWVGWNFMWKYVCPPICGFLWLSAMITELAALGDSEPWSGWTAAPSAGVVVFGWALGLLPATVLTVYFVFGPGKTAPTGGI